VAYQREILHTHTTLNRILQDDISTYLPAGFTEHIAELRLMPLYELLEKLFLLFDMKGIEHQDAYLCAFYDAVTEYMQQHSSEPTAFITYWDERLHEKTIPSGEIEGIRILSIHKSKGLEFHTVLIPFCDWKMENETNNHLIWCQAQDDGLEPFNQLDLVPVNYSSAMAESVFKASYWDERLQLWVDNLNLLYVAFTRACKNLIIWGRTGNRQKGTVSELLEQTVPQLPIWSTREESDEDTPVTYTFGELFPSETKAEKHSDNPLATPPESVTVRVESIETPIEFKQSNQSADFIQSEDESEEERKEYIRQGQLLHQVFASIRTENELQQAISRLVFEGVLESEKQAEQIEELARWALAHPHVRDWYDGTWELYNECSIIYADEAGNLQTRRPDRVMMKDGKVIVVDFKFGKKKQGYRSQVKEYMNLLTQMGYSNVKGYLWYVFENELENVRN
jgi:ATP-dependent exoDNAse (exonuclease V) beta subunit